LAKLQRDECPQAILADLGSELQKWYDEVENIIVMTNFNKDIHLAWIKQVFHCFLDMQEALTMILSEPSMAMHNRYSKPIDGIFVSQKLLPSIMGGYLAFGQEYPATIGFCG